MTIFFKTILGVSITIGLYACTKTTGPVPKVEQTSATDSELFAESMDTVDYTYYKNGDILDPEGNSPHGSFALRVNSIAASALDSSGELPETGTFPEGSIIVKEVYSGTEITLLAVMKKASKDASSGNAWLWAEYNPDGTTVVPISGKGSQCISCHSAATNRDLVLTYSLH